MTIHSAGGDGLHFPTHNNRARVLPMSVVTPSFPSLPSFTPPPGKCDRMPVHAYRIIINLGMCTWSWTSELLVRSLGWLEPVRPPLISGSTIEVNVSVVLPY